MIHNSSIATAITLLVAAVEPAAADFRKDAYFLSTGVHDGGETNRIAFRQTIHVSGAGWLRLTVGDHDLGQESFLLIRSVQTGDEQTMTATAFENWSNNTGLFGGDALELELHVAAGEQSIYLETLEVWVGPPVNPGGPPGGGLDPPEDLCGADNRVASNDPRVARMFGGSTTTTGDGGCTGWMVANGAFLTAGHCVVGGIAGSIIEFNVPASTPNGIPNFANAQNDQYPIIGTFAFENTPTSQAIGGDWAVFSAGPNANGVTPALAQGAFFRIAGTGPSLALGDPIRVTGYGWDWTPAGTGGPGAACCDFDENGTCDFNCNAQNKTLQTSTGPFIEFQDNAPNDQVLVYAVDTTDATSGSPVIRVTNDEAIGINVTSGCVSGDGNFGASFQHDVLRESVNDFPDGNQIPGTFETVYADTLSFCGPPTLGCSGRITNPHDTVADAVLDVGDGRTIVVSPGNYTAANGNVFIAGADGKSMTLIAPFGGAVIGN